MEFHNHQFQNLKNILDLFRVLTGCCLITRKMISYFVKLDEVSPMIRLVENGMSPMGKKMYIVFISSEENIRNLDKLRGINRELALNPTLSEKKTGRVYQRWQSLFHGYTVDAFN